jgi:hypothetical protein
MAPEPIAARDLPNLPGLLMGISAILVIIVGAWNRQASGVMLGLMMVASALIALGYIGGLLIKNMLSVLAVSATFGVYLFFNWVDQIVVLGLLDPRTWTIFVASLLSLFAAYRTIVLKRY